MRPTIRLTARAMLHRPGIRRGVALAFGSVTLLVLILVTTLLLIRWTAHQRMFQGADELRSIERYLQSPALLRDPAVRRSVRGHLVAAQRDFGAAHNELDAWQPFLSRLRWLPTISDRLNTDTWAANAAVYASASALHLFDGLSPAWATLADKSPNKPLLVRIVPALRSSHSQFVEAQVDAELAAANLALLPARTGDDQLDTAKKRLHRFLPGLQQGSAWLALAPTLLGDGKPSRYLLAWQNPAELRATGGFIGASDFLTLQQGAMTHRFAGRVPPPREIESVPLPLPEALYTPETYWVFCDANWSPDFPLSARLERWFYGEDTGHWADGVIDYVDTATPDILRASGPVYLPGYNRWVNAGNVTALAQHYINGRYKGPAHQGPSDSIRKQFFNAVMQALLRRLQTLPLNRWPALGKALLDAIARRDILLYDRRPAIEAAIVATGAAGRLEHPAGDYLFVVDDNRSYNKLNPYLREKATQQVAIRPDLSLDETLTLRYHVDPSPATLVGYGPYVGQWGSKHDYQEFLRVYVPAGAHLESMSGLQRWAPTPAYGLTQFAGRFLLRQGQSTTVTIHYQVPAGVLGAGNAGQYRLTIQRQPGNSRRDVRVMVRGLGGITLSPHGKRANQLDITLQSQRDAHLALSLRGSAGPRQHTLPPSPRLADPYLPYTSFNDPKHPL
jgi:Protein of unknown function (DUF4012)